MDGFLGYSYQYIYIIVVAIATMIHLNRYKHSAFVLEHNDESVGLFWMIAMILFIGFRPVHYAFTDMGSYNRYLIMWQGDTFSFTWDTDNKIFDNLFRWWGCKGIEPQLFFLFMATIYFGCSYFGIKRLFGRYMLLAYFVFLAAFSTFSYGVNGIKAGAAASIFILALSFWDNILISVPLIMVSLGFHHSMIMPIAAYVMVIFFKKPKWFYYGWFMCFILAVFHVTYFQNLFGSMADEQGAGYLIVSENSTISHIRFRPDFVLYSAVPVWLGYQFEMKDRLILSKTYATLIHFYLVTNAIWMLCMYAEFNNRIAYLSWFVYPIVIIYPFLDSNNNDPQKFIKLRKVVAYHLAFTLFMLFIYYGLLRLGH
jgi:hypothetical protein